MVVGYVMYRIGDTKAAHRMNSALKMKLKDQLQRWVTS